MAALSAKLMSSLTLRNCDSNPFHYSRRSFSSSGTTSSSEDLLKSAGGLPKAFHPARSFPLSRESDHSRRSFVVAASSELPLVGNAAAGFEAEAGCDREFRHRKSELPRVGNAAPDFEAEAVLDQEFIKVKLSEYIGKKYVILFFYPRDFTCPTEITAFSDRYVDFKRLNTEILGVSIDSVFSHLAWVQTDRKSGGLGYLKYPLISDVTKSISKSYGVLIPDEGVALRGLFIIDKEGIIQHSSINKLAIGRRIDETMRTLQAMQSVQENPDENCRGGWKMIQRQCGWQGWDMVPWLLYLTVCGIFGLCLFRNAIDPTQGPSASVPDPTPLGRHCYVSKVRGLPLSVTDPTHGLSVPVPDPTPLGWCSISKVQALSGKFKELSVPFAIMAFLNYNLLLPRMGESLIYWFIKTVLFT